MEVIDITAQLRVHPQLGQTLTLPDGSTYTVRYKRRDLAAVNGMALHHSGDGGHPSTWANYHVTPAARGGPIWTPGGLGAPGICYHRAVMWNGTIYKTNLDSTECWHTAGHNGHLFGIVCQGNLSERPPTREQIASLVWLIREELFRYDLIRQGFPDNIKGHGEWSGNNTDCPGTWLTEAVVGAIMSGG